MCACVEASLGTRDCEGRAGEEGAGWDSGSCDNTDAEEVVMVVVDETHGLSGEPLILMVITGIPGSDKGGRESTLGWDGGGAWDGGAGAGTGTGGEAGGGGGHKMNGGAKKH